jgi:RHS repeat-associated protein
MDESGNAISRSEYLPYGETWVQSGDTKNLPKFNGQELDTESGFYYFNARHYDPQIARFVTADTVVDGAATTAGWNRYMFVHGNPVMYKDPSGHFLMGGSGGFLAGLANALGIGKTPDSGGKTEVSNNTQKAVNSPAYGKEENAAVIKDLEEKINHGKADSKKTNLQKGFHVVMLENNFETSKHTSGLDEFKGKYYVIKNGEILKDGIGTSKASITPQTKSGESFDTSVNAGNDLTPGDYKIKGDLSTGKLAIFENEEKMQKGDRVIPSSGSNGTQNLLLIHDKVAKWSGGIGCQIASGFKDWAQNYSKSNDSQVTGDYHLVDMNRYRKEE